MADRRELIPVAPEPPRAFPLSIVVFCDRCGVEVEHDYVVHDLMTREQRLAVAREHMARNEGWSCTASGDYCPDCGRGDCTGEDCRTDRPAPEEITVLCAGCVGFEHCDGREGGCDCTCGLAPNWADIRPEPPDWP
jgi:hypothetical protein